MTESRHILPIKNHYLTQPNLPNPRGAYFSNMRQVTIQNNVYPVYAWFKTIDFNSK